MVRTKPSNTGGGGSFVDRNRAVAMHHFDSLPQPIREELADHPLNMDTTEIVKYLLDGASVNQIVTALKCQRANSEERALARLEKDSSYLASEAEEFQDAVWRYSNSGLTRT